MPLQHHPNPDSTLLYTLVRNLLCRDGFENPVRLPSNPLRWVLSLVTSEGSCSMASWWRPRFPVKPFLAGMRFGPNLGFVWCPSRIRSPRSAQSAASRPWTSATRHTRKSQRSGHSGKLARCPQRRRPGSLECLGARVGLVSRMLSDGVTNHKRTTRSSLSLVNMFISTHLALAYY